MAAAESLDNEKEVKVDPYILGSVLRIFTPIELESFTTQYDSANRMSLTDLLEGEFFGAPALEVEEVSNEDLELKEEVTEDLDDNILDFKIEAKDLTDKELLEALDGSEQMEVVEEDKEDSEFKLFETEEEVVEEKIDVTTFILEEKDKFKDSNFKLGKDSVLKQYEKQSKLQLDQERASKENMKSSSTSGVLLNKKVV